MKNNIFLEQGNEPTVDQNQTIVQETLNEEERNNHIIPFLGGWFPSLHVHIMCHMTQSYRNTKSCLGTVTVLEWNLPFFVGSRRTAGCSAFILLKKRVVPTGLNNHPQGATPSGPSRFLQRFEVI